MKRFAPPFVSPTHTRAPCGGGSPMEGRGEGVLSRECRYGSNGLLLRGLVLVWCRGARVSKGWGTTSPVGEGKVVAKVAD